jgi:alpha-L-fucosidase
MNGKGDVLKMLSEACKKQGIEMGVYISPWDRNHPDYGTPKYNDVYINTMKEILTGYGNFFELWWDGANGEGPNGKKQEYDFTRFKDSALKYQPQLVIFSDIGPHVRWVGNENGIINETNWNLLDTVGFKRGEGAPPNDTLNRGNYNGKHWIGAEADVSIRKGWFYHPNEDSTVKSGATLFDLYLKSVGRGGNMLLNVPPNRAGLISGVDSAALMQFKKIREEAFAHNVFKDAKILRTKNSIEIHLKKAVNFNTLVLKEAISKGQRIVQFEVSGGNNLKFFNPIAKGTTIGHKRIILIPQQSIQYIRILVTESKGLPIISEVAAYQVQNTH